MEKTRYKLTISYNGTPFCGWQIQPNAPSVQQEITHALETLLKHPVKVVGSSRTDSGVHALGQVAHFDTTLFFQKEKLLYKINALLPPEIRILSLEETDPSFHACYSATKKIYTYHIALENVVSPFLFPFRYKPRFKIDLKLLERAIPLFTGYRDFTSFSNEAHKGAASKNPFRNLFRITPIQEEGGIYLEFEGDGFLYQMVRNITGTLLDVARGKILESSIEKIFAARDRREAGTAVPPHALFLKKIFF